MTCAHAKQVEFKRGFANEQIGQVIVDDDDGVMLVAQEGVGVEVDALGA